MNIFSEQPIDSILLSATYKAQQSALRQAINRRSSIYKLTGMKELVVKFPALDRYMGLEIEVENVIFRDDSYSTMFRESLESVEILPTLFFKAVEDGSLRNHGLEFVSKPGLTGQEILTGLDLLFNQTKLFKYPFDTSHRTSIHVHANVLDLTYLQLKRLYLWYLILEPLFFSLSGNRNRNIFCVPVTETYFDFYKFAVSPNINDFDNRLNQWKKYCAFNLLPVPKFGTVEFRHHAGTNNPDVIANWMTFIYQFFDVVIGEKDRSLNDTFDLIYKSWQDDTLNVYLEKNFGIAFSDINLMNEHLKNVCSMLINLHDFKSADFTDVDASEETRKSKYVRKKSSSFNIEDTVFQPIPMTQPHVGVNWASLLQQGTAPIATEFTIHAEEATELPTTSDQTW